MSLSTGATVSLASLKIMPQHFCRTLALVKNKVARAEETVGPRDQSFRPVKTLRP